MTEKRRKSRMLPADDAGVWDSLAQTVTPLAPRPRIPPPAVVPAKPAVAAAPRAVDAAAQRAKPAAPVASADPKTVRRLRKGAMGIEATLDLHRRTLAQAHRELRRFVEDCFESGRRSVLIITGRGLGPDGETGKIRAAVPRWLDEPGFRERILASAPAQPRDGGTGALYLLIRRRR